MSLEGFVKATNVIKGIVQGVDVVYMDAYQIAVDNGFEGTVEQWLESIRGPEGPIGPIGPIGPEGPEGKAGYSVYYTMMDVSLNTATIPFNQIPMAAARAPAVGDYVLTPDGWLYAVTKLPTALTALCTRLTSLKGPDGATGATGAAGADGYSPVKGEDYYTEEDQAAIVADVLASEEISAMAQAIADLQYVPIDITSISKNVGTKEMGSTVESVTISWVLNKEPASQILNGVEMEPSARKYTLSGLSLTETRSFELTVKDERGVEDNDYITIAFYNGVYYGVLKDGATLDSAAILTLTRKLQNNRTITFTANAAADQRIVYAFPSRLSGTPTFSVGGFEGGFSKAATIDFTNASGYTESYDIWTSDNVGLGSTTVKVS